MLVRSILGWQPVRLCLLLLIATTMAAGCTPSKWQYLHSGIGSQLEEEDTANVAIIQDQYFNFLCNQAGVPAALGENIGVGCANAGLNPEIWTLVVQQGLNDIDRRCDRYLEWLDDRKRSKGPVIAQVGAVQDTTNAILGFTIPGSKAIEIVAQAFGLLTKSIENYHSRLILEVESSTVNSVVLNRRHQFRKETYNFVYQSRPAAEFALRSYLRICLPFAIETEINDYSTLGAMGIPNPGARSIHQSPMQVSVPGAAPITAITPIFKPERGSSVESGPVRIRINDSIQKALCAWPADGIKGDRTAEAIRMFQYDQGSPETGELTVNQENFIINTFGPSQPKEFGECDLRLANFLERSRLHNDPDSASGLADLRSNLTTLSDANNAGVVISPTDTLEMLRPKIKAIKEKIGTPILQSGKRDYLNTQYTPDLEKMLLN